MRSTLLTVAGLLVLGSAAALVANTTWYHIPWLREPMVIVDQSHPIPERTPPQSENDLGHDSKPAPQHDAPEAPPRARPGFILIDDVLSALADGSARFIDAREARDYDEGHLRGAIHLPSSAIYKNIDNVFNLGVMADDRVIVYCGGGECEASHNVADELRRSFNFTNVLIYEKGWEEIESSGRFNDYIETGGQP
ncbi:MAG: rhodanese-like domain-containing protein [Phycisphaerae bacterium]